MISEINNRFFGENIRSEIRLISIDLDGTLLNDEKKVSRLDIETLLECKKVGYNIVFNTARPLKMIPKKLLKYFSNDYWILSNGSTIIFKEKVIYDVTFHIKEVMPLIYWLLKEDSYFFSFESKGQIFTPVLKFKSYYSTFIGVKEAIDLELNKLLVISENCDFPHSRIDAFLNNKLKKLVTENGKYVQVMPKNVSKLSAIEKICDFLSLELQNVLSFGDDINDIELLEFSGFGVAMQNSDLKVLKSSQFVTLSNNESGISHFINNKILV